MRATLTLDDELVAQAQAYTGLTDISALIHEALTVLVAREAAEGPRKPIDWAALEQLRARLPMQDESAGIFIRRMRDDARY